MPLGESLVVVLDFGYALLARGQPAIPVEGPEMLLLPLHIVTTFYWDEFLMLLVPTTIVMVVGLEKLRLRNRAADDAAGDESEPDEVAPQRVAVADTVRQAGKSRRAPGSTRAKRHR
jgi:hypothetical protein